MAVTRTYFSIRQCYLSNLDYVMNHGSKVLDERGSETLEVQNLHSTIHFNRFAPMHPAVERLNGSIWNDEKLSDYCEQLLDPDNRGFIYTYGERLCGFDVNQVKYCIEKLKECKASRRAVAVTLRPAVDDYREEIPCLMLLDFKVRNGRMTVTALFRSNDAYGASYANLHGIYHVAEHICDEVGAVVDCIELHQCSAHIYLSDVDEAEKLLEMN